MLPNLICPKCGATLRDIPQASYHPTSYQKCRRKCVLCGVAFSNAQNDPVLIYEKIESNVPTEVRGGLDVAFDNTFNVVNRYSKENKFRLEDSEDAVTWTIFKYLMMDPTLPGYFASKFARFNTGIDPEVLLWGARISAIDYGARDSFLRASKKVGEKPNYRTEPDVIMDYGECGLVFIECKYLSSNTFKPVVFGGWGKYSSPKYFKAFNRMKQGGLYQLVRMWRIGNEMAGDRPFTLINVVRKSDLVDVQAYNKIFFGDLIKRRRNSRFITMSWDSIIKRLDTNWAIHHYAKIKNL